MGKAGQVPDYLTAGAQRLLSQPWLGMMTFSKAVWGPGNRITLTPYANRNIDIGFTDSVGYGTDRLAWFDLETMSNIPWTDGQNGPTNDAIKAAQNTAWGFVATNGDFVLSYPKLSSNDSKIRIRIFSSVAYKNWN